MVSDTRIAVGVLPWILAIWLIAEAAWDTVKGQDIPRWFSTLPILTGLLLACQQGRIWLGVGFLVSAAFTNLSFGFLRLLLVVPAVILGEAPYHPQALALVYGWMLAWAAWETGVIGGADALAIGYSLLWFPQPAMLFSLLGGILAWSIGQLLWRYRSQTLLHLWTTVANHAPGTASPALGGIALGALAFALWQVIK